MLKNTFRNWRSRVSDLVVVGLLVALTPFLTAQTAGTGALAGKVTDGSGSVVANATVTATSVDTSQARTVTTGADGSYKFELLPPGSYRVKFEAAGLKTVEISSTVNGTVTVVLDWKLEAGEPVNGKSAPQENLPNAPSSGTTAPSLQDLGISPEQTQGSAKDQARLDKRTHMLKVHQRLGLITLAPLIATFITSANAGGPKTSTTDRTTHLILGSVSGDLYFMSAYYAIRAPKIPGTETRGPIRLHKAMAWIHVPGMILTPILGAMAYDQKNKGEKVHGIASAHGPVAIVTGAAFGVAVMSVSFKF
jgi:Carboxypeptidase regulatory-like domain